MSAQLHRLQPWLQEMVDNWVLTPLEASEIEDVMMPAQEGELVMLPPQLHDAASRVNLYERPAWPTLH